MIPDWLTKDFLDLFSKDPRSRVALWFDSKAEFRPVLDIIDERFAKENINLLVFEPDKGHGALWLKWAAELGPGANTKVVLWIPVDRDALLKPTSNGARLDCLVEYQFTGLTWLIDGRTPTLFRFLKKHGVPLPTSRADQDALWRGGPDSALAKYVKANLNRDEAFWKSRTLTVAVIEESIVGDLRELLLRFLADPKNEWIALQESGIAAEFCSQLSERYANAVDLGRDPEDWARSFVRSLIAMEIFESMGCPDDFPYASELPDPSLRKGLKKFFKQWRRDRDHIETYQRWALEIEDHLDCREWARSKSGYPDALRNLAMDRWLQFLQAGQAAGSSESELRRYITENKDLAAVEVEGFWAQTTGDLSGWKLVIELVELIEKIDRAVKAVEDKPSAKALVQAYAQDWHKIDLGHWKLQAAARREQDMEILAAAADRFYLNYLEATGQAFYDAFRKGGKWPPEGCNGVGGIIPGLFEDSPQRRAILVVDALRYDLAVYLKECIGDGDLSAYIANVPSVTWVGMTGLLPDCESRLEFHEGKERLISEDSAGDLCHRSNRWKVLQASGADHLGMDNEGKRRDELHHLRSLTKKPKKLPKTLILFDRGVDAISHQAKDEAIRHYEEVLADIEWSINKLRKWGYNEIHVVTDHGFVVLHGGASLQLMEIDKDKLEKLDARWGILKEGQTSSCATVPFPLDPSWNVVLPPGLRSFKPPGRFFHGGATLQEVVIPHLKLVSERAPRQMGVVVNLPKVEIATLAVKIELLPEIPPQRDLFDTQLEPLKLRVFLGTSDSPRSRGKVVDVEAGAEETINVTLFLERDPPTPAGSEIPIQVLEADNGKNYAAGLVVKVIKDLS